MSSLTMLSLNFINCRSMATFVFRYNRHTHKSMLVSSRLWSRRYSSLADMIYFNRSHPVVLYQYSGTLVRL
jgi:hypothetical protein